MSLIAVVVLLGDVLELEEADDNLSGRFRERPFLSPPVPTVGMSAPVPEDVELTDREALREDLPAPTPPPPPPTLRLLRGGGPSSFCRPPINCMRRARDAFSSRPEVAITNNLCCGWGDSDGRMGGEADLVTAFLGRSTEYLVATSFKGPCTTTHHTALALHLPSRPRASGNKYSADTAD